MAADGDGTKAGGGGAGVSADREGEGGSEHAFPVGYRGRPDLMALRLAEGLFARVYHRTRLITRCPMPASGPAVLVSNHISGLDWLLLQACCPRPVVWLMASEWYHDPSLHWFYKWKGCVPVRRGESDRDAIRTTLSVLERGGLVGVFPEGRWASGEMLPFQRGAALLAIRSGATVIPACVEGTQRNTETGEAFVRRRVATVAFGRPMRFGRTDVSRGAVVRATEAIEARIRGLAGLIREKVPDACVP